MSVGFSGANTKLKILITFTFLINFKIKNVNQMVWTAERELIHQREPISSAASAVAVQHMFSHSIWQFAISVDGCRWLGSRPANDGPVRRQRERADQTVANGHTCGQKNKELVENSWKIDFLKTVDYYIKWI